MSPRRAVPSQRPRELMMNNCINCECQIVFREWDFRWIHSGTSNLRSGHLCWPGVSEDVVTPESDRRSLPAALPGGGSLG